MLNNRQYWVLTNLIECGGCNEKPHYIFLAWIIYGAGKVYFPEIVFHVKIYGIIEYEASCW